MNSKSDMVYKSVVRPVKYWREKAWLNEMGLKGWQLWDTVTSYKSKTRTYKFRKLVLPTRLNFKS